MGRNINSPEHVTSAVGSNSLGDPLTDSENLMQGKLVIIFLVIWGCFLVIRLEKVLFMSCCTQIIPANICDYTAHRIRIKRLSVYNNILWKLDYKR
jgi:hypothetical protein